MATEIRRMYTPQTATIPNGTAISQAIPLKDVVIVSLLLPAAWTAAAITFDGSLDGTTYTAVYDDAGTELTISSATASACVGKILVLKDVLDKLAGLQSFKIRSGTVGTPVNQGAARTFGLGLKG